jgi:CRISPR-associated protein Cas5d
MERSRSFSVLISGPLALFTRPEMKAERVSYEVITPSAARGILEAILWKPAIRWVVTEIAVLSDIRWTSFRRNEVRSRLSPRNRGPYFADEDREQRNTVALRDVRYRISAHLELTPKASAEEHAVKFEEMFERRLEKGQHFHQPYLGCREMAADVAPASGALAPIALTKPLGLMFYDFEYSKNAVKPLFFEARLERGVLTVPAWSQVRRENGLAEV